MLSPLTKRLVDTLQTLPGIGPKTAQRLAFQLLAAKGREKGLALAESLQQAMHQVQECHRCRLYTEESICSICRSTQREQNVLCVVESPADVFAIEQTASYKGLYFILQGRLSPLDGLGPKEIGIPALLSRLEKEPISELILATNQTMEGKATAHYIASHIDNTRITCTRIAQGVPFGGELEYLDGSTLSYSIRSRIPIEN
ncbi:MAG: recombination protein RecR [Proteobacteria bacterium]|nr:recombination protein RecR [Pseudomonadota bacterium]